MKGESPVPSVPLSQVRWAFCCHSRCSPPLM
nr:MAG TPA: Protein of unknown function (DUF585) [Caudoviricetes sp.]